MRIDIENFKIRYVTEKEAKELREEMSFHPAYYPSYGSYTVLLDGEIGCIDQIKTRFIIKKENKGGSMLIVKILSMLFLFICFSGMFMICNDNRMNDMSALEFWGTEFVILVVIIVLSIMYK